MTTKRESNVAQLEHQCNTDWQDTINSLLDDEMHYMRTYVEVSKVLEILKEAKMHAACNLLSIAMRRVIVEAVRQEILPPQKLENEQ